MEAATGRTLTLQRADGYGAVLPRRIALHRAASRCIAQRTRRIALHRPEDAADAGPSAEAPRHRRHSCAAFVGSGLTKAFAGTCAIGRVRITL